MILVGDVGATKTLLSLGEMTDSGWVPAIERRYADCDYTDFQELIGSFLVELPEQGVDAWQIERSCLGVAGPAQDGISRLTNRPWDIDSRALATQFSIPRPVVVNDMVATASGIRMLDSDDLITLQENSPLPDAPKLVIGVGTGLGTACVVANSHEEQVLAGEGGHMGFAPRNPEQLALWEFLYGYRSRVSIEDVASGTGITNIHRFITQTDGELHQIEENYVSPASISYLAINENDAISQRTLDTFMDCLGAAVGDLALALLPYGGVYLTGGIPVNLRVIFEQGRFIEAFNDKSAQSNLTRRMPVHIVHNEKVALLGCARIATSSHQLRRNHA